MYDKIPHCDTIDEVSIPQPILDLFENAAVKLNPKIEAQKVINGVVYLGLRCGPCYTWEALVHEIAHFIEINEARMDQDGWGFKWPQDDPTNGFPQNFATSAHIERELRVHAIALHLFEWAGVNVDPEDLTSSLHFMDYWSIYAEIDQIALPTTKNLTHYKVFDRKMQIWGAIKVREYYKNYNIDDILAEWYRRNDLLTKKG
jgi:hypothetical protein